MRWRSIAGLALPSLLACSPEPQPTPPDPRIAALAAAPARCGAAAYRWVDDATLGEVLESKELPLYRMTRETIRSLLGQTDWRIAEPQYGTAAWLVRYRTQDRGAPVEATAVVSVPVTDDGEAKEFPVLAFLHGTCGFTDACAPSRGADGPASATLLASLGYVAISPDYIGMLGTGEPAGSLHPYLVSEATAIASLDAVRAARKLLPTIDITAKAAPGLLLLGGSQGGHAVLATNRLQPYYAPEEKIVAAAASVPPADLVTEAERAIASKVNATYNFVGVLAAAGHWYGAPLSEALQAPWDAQVPAAMRAGCKFDSLQHAADDFDKLFQPALREEASRGFPEGGSRWGCILRENSPVYTSVEALSRVPTMFVLSEEDNLVHTPIERHSFDRLCDQGERLEYLECAGLGHTEGAVASLPEQLAFLAARRAGEPWPAEKICHRGPPVRCQGTPD